MSTDYTLQISCDIILKQDLTDLALENMVIVSYRPR